MFSASVLVLSWLLWTKRRGRWHLWHFDSKTHNSPKPLWSHFVTRKLLRQRKHWEPKPSEIDEYSQTTFGGCFGFHLIILGVKICHDFFIFLRKAFLGGISVWAAKGIPTGDPWNLCLGMLDLYYPGYYGPSKDDDDILILKHTIPPSTFAVTLYQASRWGSESIHKPK